MALTLDHPEGQVAIEERAPGRRRVTVRLADAAQFSPCLAWETRYPVELIRTMLNVKGPAYLCNEIMREEDPEYVERELLLDLTAYVPEREFAGRRILDFGCGAGASTAILARRFPAAQIVGVELSERLLSLARARAAHYGLTNVRLLVSPSGDRLPPDLGAFDYVVLSAVYEHLLPAERPVIMRLLWEALKPGGVLFIDQTPYRYWPVEAHTTGLPLLNYLPDGLAAAVARRFSRRVPRDAPWEDLQRFGIRGGAPGEIMKYLMLTEMGKPKLLAPRREGLRDRIDLWFEISGRRRPSRSKRLAYRWLKLLRRATGLTLTPAVAIAIARK